METPKTVTADRHQRRERRHHQRLQQIIQMKKQSAATAPPQRKRTLERMIRISAVALYRWGRQRGHSVRTIAAKLWLSARLLRDWFKSWNEHQLTPAPRGRPPGPVTPEQRQRVIEILDAMGPKTGVPTLQGLFPEIPRRALRHLLERYRTEFRRRKAQHRHQLTWHTPSAAWTIDYTEPPTPIDGLYRTILVVRDLATGMCLEALPCPRQNGHVAARALDTLFYRYGAPLVLKLDNGSPLIAGPMRALLHQYQVVPLLSPPGMPRFNGAVEAGIGSLKTRAHHIADRRGRPWEWTCDDVEGARQQANQTARPRGHNGPTPEQSWAETEAIIADERDAFLETLRRDLNTRREEYSSELDHDILWQRNSSVVRSAIRHVLEVRGHLSTKKGVNSSTN